MENKIEIPPGTSLEKVVHILTRARAKNQHVYCEFSGHLLHSDTISMDSAFVEVTGHTRAEYKQMMKELSKQYKQRKKLQRLITLQEVIDGLKFIAEHRSLTQDELESGLLEMGCDFTIHDIQKQFPKAIPLYEGMRKGSISSGASTIVNMRDSERGRYFGDEKFLDVDDDMSIYHFIRLTTGDENYTKEYVDSLSASNEMHR